MKYLEKMNNLDYKVDPNYLIQHGNETFKFKDLVNHYLRSQNKVK